MLLGFFKNVVLVHVGSSKCSEFLEHPTCAAEFFGEFKQHNFKLFTFLQLPCICLSCVCILLIFIFLQVISEIIDTGKSHDFTDVILVHEHRGVPDGIIISHLPNGPTAYFGLLNVVSSYSSLIVYRPEVFCRLCEL